MSQYMDAYSSQRARLTGVDAFRRALTATGRCGFGKGSLAVMSCDENARGEFLRARREQLEAGELGVPVSSRAAAGHKPRGA